MKRDLTEYVKEYDSRFSGGLKGGRWTASDPVQIAIFSECGSLDNGTYKAIGNALKAGFIAGMRYKGKGKKYHV